ncbi:hypothetical protein D1871_22335 [Nakamurella silvestris]|nr:hypothetical protein D1871_22335 [Nakamurella silvestris]
MIVIVSSSSLSLVPATGATAPVSSRGLLPLLRQALKFMLVGGAGTGAYVLLYLVLAGPLGSLPANGVAWLLTTVATNNLHRWFTFGIRRPSSPAADEIVGLVSSLIALLLTTLALGLLDTTTGPAQVIALVAVNGLVGTARFLFLRGWFSR